MAKRSYAQFCPMARTLDVLGERWTLLIVRELLTGPKRYTDLKQALGGMWSNLLGQRLRELEEAGIVQRAELPPPAARTVYELTERGRELEDVLLSIARFGLPYLDVPTDEQPLQPHHVVLGLRALVRIEELPDTGLTVRFDIDEGSYLMTVVPARDPGRRVAAQERIDVSELPDAITRDDENNGSEADVIVRSSLPVLLWIRRGDLTVADAEDQALVEISGGPPQVAAARHVLSSET